jgi:hypothetical protein
MLLPSLVRTRILGFSVSEESGSRNMSDLFAHNHGGPVTTSWRDELAPPGSSVNSFLCAIEASSELRGAVGLSLSAEPRVLVCLPPDSKKTAIIAATCVWLDENEQASTLIYVIGSSTSQLQCLGKHFFFTCNHLQRPIQTEYWRKGPLLGAIPADGIRVVLVSFEGAATDAFKKFFECNIQRTMSVFVDEAQEMVNHYSFRRWSIEKLHFILARPCVKYRFLSGMLSCLYVLSTVLTAKTLFTSCHLRLLTILSY